jgi:pimeloyl-ACP methyl ester carboxylesterase
MNSDTAEALEEQQVRLTADSVSLAGDLCVPPRATGTVLFAHGSGSGRFSTRNRFVAHRLQESGLATLLIDLLTEQEEAADRFTAHIRFDIPLLAERLVGAVEWLKRDPRTALLPIGCFGASTGGGAALVAATRLPERIAAVVSRGGRPDLAGAALPQVKAPTLLIVGGDDVAVIGLNEEALEQLGSPIKRMVIVPDATHLFEEPGKLEEVARLAADWFVKHLRATR